MPVSDRRPDSGHGPGIRLPLNARLALQPARIATGSEDESGVLVLADGRIVAVLVRLDAPFHGDAQGRWYLEAGFGGCAGAPAPFGRLSEGLAWIAQRLDGEVADLADVLAEADRVLMGARDDGSRPPPPPPA